MRMTTVSMFHVQDDTAITVALVVLLVFLVAALIAKMRHRHAYELRDLQLKLKRIEEERIQRENQDR